MNDASLWEENKPVRTLVGNGVYHLLLTFIFTLTNEFPAGELLILCGAAAAGNESESEW